MAHPDCSKRYCPWGDDPLTYNLPSAIEGQTWTIVVQHNDSFAHAGAVVGYTLGEIKVDLSLEIDDLHGTTHRSRAWTYDASAEADIGGGSFTPQEFENLLLDIPAIQSLKTQPTIVTDAVAFTTTYTFTLFNPYRVADVRVKYKDECTVAGCYPMKAEMEPKVPDGDNDLITISVTPTMVTPVAATPIDPALLESAQCSNRGICEESTGECQCFEGHYGLACERQTILV